MSLSVLYFLHSTSVLSFYIDVVLTLSINDAKSLAKMFSEYFTQIVYDIGYSDPISEGNDGVSIYLNVKYDNHSYEFTYDYTNETY